MTDFVLVHGYNVRDKGWRTIDGLGPWLEKRGHTVDTDSADYGWHGLIKVRFFHQEAVDRIARALGSADAVVTHSNGANYTMKALRLVQRPIKVIHISPALNRRVKIPECVTEMHVFHTAHDMAVKASRLLRWHPWGDMGAKGYKGNDPRVTNHDYSDVVYGHSDWFKGLNCPYFASRIEELCR